MSMNYRLADMLTQIRNGQGARLAKVTVAYSKFLAGVCDVLVKEGFVEAATKKDIGAGKSVLEIELKYHEGESVIKELKPISKPGRRVYSKIGSLPKFSNGLGVAILSTSHGVMSDFDARQANLGGEVLCSVF